MSFWRALQAGLIPEWRSEKYLAWVRTLPSVLSGRSPCDAHHLVGHGLKGKGGKVSDMLVIPLTRDEHNELHAHGSAEWERNHDDQRIYVMQTLVESLHRGVLKVKT